jgi:hypothetical protein
MPLLTRRDLLIFALIAPMAKGFSAQPVVLRLDGDYVHAFSPKLDFITAKMLERLHDGASVAFLGQVSLSLDGNATVSDRSVARFALSYDIWEEKFSVTRVQQTRRSAAHLSLQAAQSWILDNLNLNAGALPQDRPFWLRFELRTEDPADGLGVVGESGINLTRLVEIFSRPPRTAQQRWVFDAGPLQYRDLRAQKMRY